MIVRVPASSANLGPGFDTLGMALGLHARLALAPDGLGERTQRADEHHPATVAFRAAGGTGDLWLAHGIPAGRGLGFSGAMRAGGAALAALSRGAQPDRHEVLRVAAELEGHADNAAASIFGGVVAVAADRVVPVPVAVDAAVVVWIPGFVTATDRARRSLPTTVPFADAVFNVGRTALLVAALAAGDVAALRDASADRLHQDVRLADAAPSRAALEAALAGGAWCAWLSGSGPTVAALCASDRTADVAASLPADGTARVLPIDRAGLVVEPA